MKDSKSSTNYLQKSKPWSVVPCYQGQAELETDKKAFPRDRVIDLKKRAKAFNSSTMEAIDNLTMKEIIGDDDEVIPS